MGEAQLVNAQLVMGPSGFPFATVLSEHSTAFIHSLIRLFIQLLLVVYRISEGMEDKVQPCLQDVYLEENLGFILWSICHP